MPWTDDGKYRYPAQTNKNNTKSTPTQFDGEWDKPRDTDTVGVGIAGDNLQTVQDRDYSGNQVFRRIKNSPEMVSVMEAVIDDIIGSGVRMRYVGRTSGAENPGKRQVNDAERFWRDNKEEIADSIRDAMAMGDGYIYMKGLNMDEARKSIKNHVHANFDFNDDRYAEVATEYLVSKAQDDIEGTKELQMVPASSVEHEVDEFGNVERYVQNVDAEYYDLDPDKVIRHSYTSLNGETYGFSPAVSLFAELDMLANAKDYNSIRFDNAAVPNKTFKLPNDGPNGQNFEMVKQTLKKYRQLENKHRDLVLTGDIEIEDMNDATDMEFRELAQYITRVLVMAWGVPPSRVGGVIGSEGATESAMAQEGYNKRIKRMQDKYETILNRQLFEPLFDVQISFKDPDIKSEIRRAERDLRKTEVVKQQMAMGLMSKPEAMRYLGKRRDQVSSDVDESEMVETARGMSSSQEDMDNDSSLANSSAEETVNQEMTPNRNGGNDPSVTNQ